MAVGFPRGKIHVAFQAAAPMVGEVVVLRTMGAEGGEALFAMRGAIDQQIGRIIAIEQARQGMILLPRMDRQDRQALSAGQKNSPMDEKVCGMPVLTTAPMGDHECRAALHDKVADLMRKRLD